MAFGIIALYHSTKLIFGAHLFLIFLALDVFSAQKHLCERCQRKKVKIYV